MIAGYVADVTVALTLFEVGMFIPDFGKSVIPRIAVGPYYRDEQLRPLFLTPRQHR